MKLMAGIGINPQMFPESPQLPSVIKIEGEFTEESFAEYMREAFQTAEEPQFLTAPPVTAEKRENAVFIPRQASTEEEQTVASCLLSLAIPAIVDEQPKITELELAVTPQIPDAPETPEAPQTPEAPKLAQPEQPEAPEVAEPQNPIIAEKPEARQPAEKSEMPLITEMKPPEEPRIVTAPAAPEPTQLLQEVQQAQQEVIQSYGEAIKVTGAEIPQAELPEVQLAKLPVIDMPKTEQTAVPEAEAKAPQAPAKHVAVQLTQEAKQFLEKFGEVKYAIENGKNVQFSTMAEQPDEELEALKAWQTLHKAQVAIKEKPEEFNELLEKFKAENPAGRDAPKKSETPKETPQIQTAAFAEPKPQIANLAKADLPQPQQLPQSTIAQVSEQIFARLAAPDGTTTFEMILNPAELGKIAVKIVVQATGTAIEITAEKAATAQLLQNSADRIGLALERGDARLESFVVNVESKPDYSEQRENQNRGGQQQQEQDEQGEEEQGLSFAELLQAS
jgi:flagellar hook-length control protein FliK